MQQNKLLRSLIKQVVIEALSEAPRKRKKEKVEDGPGRPREDPNTPLARWVDRLPGGTEQAADIFDYSIPHLNKLIRKDARPTIDGALEIEKKTTGAVPIETWLDK